MKKSTDSGQTGPDVPSENFARIDAIVTPPSKIIECPAMDFKERVLYVGPMGAGMVV